ncbi:unnamed protein product [Closterium sp. NIES-54]
MTTKTSGDRVGAESSSPLAASKSASSTEDPDAGTAAGFCGSMNERCKNAPRAPESANETNSSHSRHGTSSTNSSNSGKSSSNSSSSSSRRGLGDVARYWWVLGLRTAAKSQTNRNMAAQMCRGGNVGIANSADGRPVRSERAIAARVAAVARVPADVTANPVDPMESRATAAIRPVKPANRLRNPASYKKQAPVLPAASSRVEAAAMGVGMGGQAERQQVQVCTKYSLAEVVQATSEWAESRRIGGGSFGDVYKGKCPHNPHLVWAVKRAKVFTNDFKREVKEMATKNHPNLVRLVGYCLDFSPVTERMEQIVIYEFMPHGDLEQWIGPSAKQTLTIRQRLDILIGTARGLEYLHEFGVVHRDIKPANILLDVKMKAKVADFGLVRHGEGTSVAATRVMGTPGYVDPAYYKSQKATPMADVHSFGVVMLTVLTARKAICNLESDQANLKTWVAPLVASNNVAAFKDPDLIASDTIILRLARLALNCTAMPTASRPSMSRVLAELTLIKEDCLGPEANRMAERIDKELDTSISQDFDGELARIACIKSQSLM